MEQLQKKEIFLESKLSKELSRLPKDVKIVAYELLKELSIEGFLEYPDSKKLSNYNLFEIRISLEDEWRIFYSYVEEGIIILTVFKKKTQKTPKEEIRKALLRLRKI